MNNSILRDNVIKLRQQGNTYYEIQKILDFQIPKSTLSYWCKGIKLPEVFLLRLKKMSKEKLDVARKKSLIVNKNKQELLLKNIKNNSKKCASRISSLDVAKIALAFLYLGEGAKWNGHRGLMLGSSDPLIVKLYIKLLKKCFKISNDDLRCRISYRADQEISALESYWSELTGIKRNNFYKTIPDPRTKSKRTLKKGYMGVCVITCKGTRNQLELEAITKLAADYI